MNGLLDNKGQSKWARVAHSCIEPRCTGAYTMIPEPVVRVRVGIEIDDDIHSAVIMVRSSSVEFAHKIAESFRASVEADVNANARLIGAGLVPGEQWLNLV